MKGSLNLLCSLNEGASLKEVLILNWGFLTLLGPVVALRATPYAFLLTASKRMLRSTPNFLTFPKYQKQKKIEKIEFHFFNPPPPGGGV